MVIPVSTPQVVAFLEHLATNRSDVRSLFDRRDIADLIEQFEMVNGRSFEERYWRDFIERMESKVGLAPLERVVLGNSSGQLSRRDPLVRYRDVSNHAIFFHDSISDELRDWLHRHILALHERSGDAFDVYEYTVSPSLKRKPTWPLRQLLREEAKALSSATRSHLNKLSPIPGAAYSNIEGLPSLLLWSPKCHVMLPLADIARDSQRMAQLVEGLVLVLSKGEFTEFDVDELRRLVDIVRYPEFQVLEVEPDQADVFVSYRRTERPLAEAVVETLTRNGSTVWYDQFIAHAELFRSRIYAQISRAKTVLVCWTNNSAHSPWVKLEAEEARKQGKLLPLLFDGQRPPASFEGIQGVQLGAVERFTGHEPAFERLIEALVVRHGASD